MIHKIPTLVLLIGQIVLFQELAIAEADRPNVVLIMADDLGYPGLGCYGSKKNVAKDHPERVAAMLQEAKKQLADIHARTIPLGGPPVTRNAKPPAHLASP